MPRRNIVPAWNRRVERLAKTIAHARRQKLIDNLGWLFTSEPQDADIEETSNLVRQDDGVAKDSADVPAFSEESRLISSGWKAWPREAQMYPAFLEESRLDRKSVV